MNDSVEKEDRFFELLDKAINPMQTEDKSRWEQRFDLLPHPYNMMDYGLVKLFVSQELDKAREEGRQEGVKGKFYEKVLVESEYEVVPEVREIIRQEEQTRILGIIEKMIEEPRQPDPETYISDLAWNQALEALKEKLTKQE